MESYKKKKMSSRRITSLSFSRDSVHLLIADKTGDIYSMHTLDDTDISEPLAGHISMILDIAVSDDGRYVLIADRDDKIRVTCWPHMFSIQSFCLGHQGMVSKIACIHGTELAISTSGDGTIRMWNFVTGQLIYTYNISDMIDAKYLSFLANPVASAIDISRKNPPWRFVPRSLSISKYGFVAIAIDGAAVISILSIKENTLVPHMVLEVPGPCSVVAFDEAGMLWATTSTQVPVAVFNVMEFHTPTIPMRHVYVDALVNNEIICAKNTGLLSLQELLKMTTDDGSTLYFTKYVVHLVLVVLV